MLLTPNDKYVIELTADTTAVYGNIIDLYDFDRCTGVLSNERNIIVPDTNLLACGCSFSPNGRYLYVSTNIDLFQYDTYSSNINASIIKVATWDTLYSPLKTTFLFHQLAPDGKIYICTAQGSNLLHIIQNPDDSGTACNFIQNSFFLPIPNALCMPNAPNYDLGAWIGSPCDTLGLGLPSTLGEELSISVSPNPANSIANFVYHLPTNKHVTLTIYDGYGKIVARQSLYGVFRNFMLHTDKLANGLYYWVAQNGEVSTSGKLVVVH
ncbi:MAG: T9SS type A sorting domain-containing protein [Bacteroidetes bacterium]|nr:T9SS type A sorting domain-containing protein [Bacteroidota bacterium]